MPLSAAFHFFFPFLSKKKYHNIIFLSNPIFLFFLHISPFFQFQFSTNIRNLALVIKYNKILEDFKDVQNSLKMKGIAKKEDYLDGLPF